MLHYGGISAFGDFGLGILGRPVNIQTGIKDRSEILDFLKSKENAGCCTLYLMGHRGGETHQGGIVTYPDPDNPHEAVEILPNDDFEKELRKIFEGRCKRCVINIVTCGGTNNPAFVQQGKEWRKQIANNTGCKVCGSACKDHFPEYWPLDPCKSGNFKWEYECEVPDPSKSIGVWPEDWIFGQPQPWPYWYWSY
jgi:hypothetical protein